MKLAKTDSQLFIEFVMQGIECWTKAGEIAAMASESDPNWIDDVCDKCPDITPECVKRFIDIGRKKLHPRLAISEAPGVRRLRRLPYAVQEKFSNEPLELLVSSGSGWETLRVDVRNLTPDQAAQVLDEDGPRSIAAQRAYIEDRAAKRVAPPIRASLPYRIVGKKLVVMTGCTLERKDLTKILGEME